MFLYRVSHPNFRNCVIMEQTHRTSSFCDVNKTSPSDLVIAFNALPLLSIEFNAQAQSI